MFAGICRYRYPKHSDTLKSPYIGKINKFIQSVYSSQKLFLTCVIITKITKYQIKSLKRPNASSFKNKRSEVTDQSNRWSHDRTEHECCIPM